MKFIKVTLTNKGINYQITPGAVLSKEVEDIVNRYDPNQLDDGMTINITVQIGGKCQLRDDPVDVYRGEGVTEYVLDDLGSAYVHFK